MQMVMTNLRESNSDESYDQYSEDSYDDSMRGMHDPSWDLWEEWMGWEGAGIRDYTSHINPYIWLDFDLILMNAKKGISE